MTPWKTDMTATASMAKSSQCHRRMSARRNGMAHHQGLTPVHVPAQRERFMWDRGCIGSCLGVFRRCKGVLWGYEGVFGTRTSSGRGVIENNDSTDGQIAINRQIDVRELRVNAHTMVCGRSAITNRVRSSV